MIGVQVLGERVNQLGKERQHTSNYKIGYRNLMLRKFREVKRMIIFNWNGGEGTKEGFVEKVTFDLTLNEWD